MPATLDDRQLAAVLRKAGVSAGPAAILVAVAHPESGGNPDAINPDDNGGTQSSYGIWQISNGTHSPPSPQWSNPLVNARLAAGKLSSQGLSAWGTYDSGAYQPYLSAAQQAVSAVYSMSLDDVTKLADQAAKKAPPAATTTSAVSALGGVLSAGTGTLHGVSLMLDRFLALGAPGQGWRFVFGAGTLGAAFGAFKTYTAGGEDGEGHLPLAIALTGAAAIGAFMTLRPWPQTSQGSIKPGAYVADILKGQPPPAGPQSVSPAEVDLTETFLGSLIALWAAAKVARAASAGGSILQDILAALGLSGGGPGGGAGGEEPAPVEPVEPVEPLPVL